MATSSKNSLKKRSASKERQLTFTYTLLGGAKKMDSKKAKMTSSKKASSKKTGSKKISKKESSKKQASRRLSNKKREFQLFRF